MARKVHAWDWKSAIDQTACAKPRRNRSMESWVRSRVTCADCLSVVSSTWPSDVLPARARREGSK